MNTKFFKKFAVSAVAVGLLAASAAAQTWNCGMPANGRTVTNENPATSAVRCALVGGTLTVSGKGAMANYDCGNCAPWSDNNARPPRESRRITRVVIQNGVTGIGKYAFSGTNITTVTIPNSVTSIGTRAFMHSQRLTSITIPNSVTDIGFEAFGNSGLRSVTIGDGVTIIRGNEFESCTSLTSIKIGNGVVELGDNFLDSFLFRSRFDRRRRPLTSMEIGANNSRYSFENGILFSKAKDTLFAYVTCAGVTSVTIPSSVTTIGRNAFEGCKDLTSVTIPNSVITIGNSAFSETGLTSLTIPNSVEYIGERAFAHTDLVTVTLGTNLMSIGNTAFRFNSLRTVISLKQVPPKIWNSAYYTDNYPFPFGDSLCLNVPASSIEAYKNWWRLLHRNIVSFRCIEAIESDSTLKVLLEPAPTPASVSAPAQTQESPGSFTDPRDSTVYRTVRIGNRTWMAENLNYQTRDSWCYDNNDENCAKYGRLYTWMVARKACPAGWRLPSDADWNDLMTAVGGVKDEGSTIWKNAGSKLRTKIDWNTGSNSIVGTDEFGFSALPSGSGRRRTPQFSTHLNPGDPVFGRSASNHNRVGNYCAWWSATETGPNNSQSLSIYYNSDSDGVQQWGGGNDSKWYDVHSVRCVMD